MKSRLWLFVLVLLFGSVALDGCSDNPSESGLTRSISLAFRQEPGSLKSVPDSLGLDTVKILLRRIKFHSAISDDSGDVYTPSVVIKLATDGSLTTVYVNSIKNGVYDRVRFRLHKPEDGEVVSDPEFVEGMSGDQRFSVIVKGRRNDTSFVFKSRANADQEVAIVPPVLVQDSIKDINVTLLVDPWEWFRAGSVLLDPRDPANADQIDDNIKRSFVRAIRDNNRDGRDD